LGQLDVDSGKSGLRVLFLERTYARTYAKISCPIETPEKDRDLLTVTGGIMLFAVGNSSFRRGNRPFCALFSNPGGGF
jgi:hypothetical protein